MDSVDLTNNLTAFYMNPVNVVSTGKIFSSQNVYNLKCLQFRLLAIQVICSQVFSGASKAHAIQLAREVFFRSPILPNITGGPQRPEDTTLG